MQSPVFQRWTCRGGRGFRCCSAVQQAHQRNQTDIFIQHWTKGFWIRGRMSSRLRSKAKFEMLISTLSKLIFRILHSVRHFLLANLYKNSKWAWLQNTRKTIYFTISFQWLELNLLCVIWVLWNVCVCVPVRLAHLYHSPLTVLVLSIQGGKSWTWKVQV